MTTTTTDAALYRLMTWLSPAFPIGGFTTATGIESAVEAGLVRDRGDVASIGSRTRCATAPG